MKLCPHCNAKYDDDTTFCKKDGARLLTLGEYADAKTKTVDPDYVKTTRLAQPIAQINPKPANNLKPLIAVGLLAVVAGALITWWLLKSGAPASGGPASSATATDPLLSVPTPSRETAATPKPASPTDSEYTERLLGSWESKQVNEDGSGLEDRTTYMVGGRMASVGIMKKGDRSLPLMASGTWKVQDGHLYTTMESTNLPELIPKGYTVVEKILSINDHEFVAKDADGETVVYTRSQK